MLEAIRPLPRYVACGQVTKRPVFEFVDTSIRPNAQLMVFPFSDDYSFGVLQSTMHWEWFVAQCSTLKRDPRYTSTTVFETFPWPQTPTLPAAKAVAAAGRNLRAVRRRIMSSHGLSLRQLYRALDQPGEHPLKKAQEQLDLAVSRVFGRAKSRGSLEFLLDLNDRTAERASRGEAITLPGLPVFKGATKLLLSTDRLQMPPGWPC